MVLELALLERSERNRRLASISARAVFLLLSKFLEPEFRQQAARAAYSARLEHAGLGLALLERGERNWRFARCAAQHPAWAEQGRCLSAAARADTARAHMLQPLSGQGQAQVKSKACPSLCLFLSLRQECLHWQKRLYLLNVLGVV